MRITTNSKYIYLPRGSECTPGLKIAAALPVEVAFLRPPVKLETRRRIVLRAN